MLVTLPDEDTLTLFAETMLFWRIKCGYYKRMAPEGVEGGRGLVRHDDDAYGQLLLDAYAYAHLDRGGNVVDLNKEDLVFNGENVDFGPDPPDNGRVMRMIDGIWEYLYGNWEAFRLANAVAYVAAPKIENEETMAVAVKTLLAFIPGAIGGSSNG